MPQNDFSIANQGFPAFRADLNSALQALASNSSGATAPGTTYAYQFWYDTSTNLLKMRNGANSNWITLARFDQATNEWEVRTAVVQAVDSAGVVIKTDDGTTRLTVADDGTVTLANDLVVTGDISATTINGIPLRPGVLDPENRIINGAFDFWQRGTSQTTGGYGSADRWNMYRSGQGTTTVSRTGFTIGTVLGTNNPRYHARVSTSGEQFCSLYQPIEDVRSYAGQTITILGWARRVSGSGNLGVKMVQSFGTGGSPSAAVYTGIQIITLGTNFAPFAATISVPSVTGKTLGTNGNDSLFLEFILSDSGGSLGLQTIGVDLWGIHIKVGTHTADATSLYRQPELGPELARCQRYYQTGYIKFWLWSSGSGQSLGQTVSFPVWMRSSPAVKLTRIEVGSTTSVICESANNNGMQVYGMSSVSAIIAPSMTYTADAEL